MEIINSFEKNYRPKGSLSDRGKDVRGDVEQVFSDASKAEELLGLGGRRIY